MPEHPYLDDLPAYALGALSPEERRRLEAHLGSGCDLCEVELRALRETVARLPYALPAPPLPADLKAKLFERLDSQKERAPAARPVHSWGDLLALAAVLLAAVILGVLWNGSRHELDHAREENARLTGLLARQEKELSWLRDPNVQVALLKGLAETPTAKAKLLWHPATAQGLLYVHGLPPLPLEKSYELWAFVKDEPLPSGTFDTRAGGATVIPLARLAGAPDRPVKFAVSIEPKGGVPKPTGSIVLLGETF